VPTTASAEFQIRRVQCFGRLPSAGHARRLDAGGSPPRTMMKQKWPPLPRPISISQRRRALRRPTAHAPRPSPSLTRCLRGGAQAKGFGMSRPGTYQDTDTDFDRNNSDNQPGHSYVLADQTVCG
jgi:hypothetical protein